ncbi:MAG: hypothetical protein P8130_03395 [Deltaproteobacteria bacterium]
MTKPAELTKFYTKIRIQHLFVFIISLLIILAGCSERSPEHKDKEVKYGATDKYKIIFYLSGDDFASVDEMKVLNRIRAKVESRDIGEVISSGSGMGNMTMVFKLHKDKSLEDLKDIVLEVYPKAAYRIEPEIEPPVNSKGSGQYGYHLEISAVRRGHKEPSGSGKPCRNERNGLDCFYGHQKTELLGI